MLRFVFTFIILFRVAFPFAHCRQATPSQNSSPLMTGYLKLHISTSSFFYQANDKVFFSVFILHPATLDPIQFKQSMELVVLNSREQSVYSRTFYSDQGLISSMLPATLFSTGGAYTLLATASLNGQVFKTRRTIIVQSVIKNSFLFTISPDKEQYQAGDSIGIKFNVRQQNGEAVRYTRLQVSEQYNSNTANVYDVMTDNKGMAELRVRLNNEYVINDLMFSAQVVFQGQKFTCTERINLNTGIISFNAFFENGAYNPEIDNPLVMICSNENGELANHSFWVIQRETSDSVLVKTNAFGLCRYKLPKGGETSNVVIKSANHKSGYLKLSVEHPGGMTLGTWHKTSSNIMFSVYSGISKEVLLLSHVRGIKVAKRKLRIMRGWNYFDLDISKFQQGVLQTLLMDSVYNILAEKLVYIHPDKTLHFKLDKYRLNASREKELNITVSDHEGKPVRGIFTLSISDENNFVTLKDKQAKIVENLMFENELNYPVKDIGKLFESKNDSLLDLFLTGCSMKNSFWKQILLDDNQQKELFCYSFRLMKSSANRNEEISTIKKLTFYSGKGKYSTHPRNDGTVLVPVDTLTFPATCYVRFGNSKEIIYVDKKDASIVLLRDSVFISGTRSDERIIVLKNRVTPSIQFVEEPKVTGLQGRGPGKDGTAVFVDGVSTFFCGITTTTTVSFKLQSCGLTSTYSSYNPASRSGMRNIAGLAGLSSGVTVTRTGLSGRGSRVDGTAYYVDGVRIMNNSPDIQTNEKISRVALQNMPVTYDIPQVNDMQGSGLGNRYYSSSHYYASQKAMFFFYHTNQAVQSYISAFDYESAVNDPQTISCYYYYSHFSTDSEGKGTLNVKTPDNAQAWHVNIQGTGQLQCGYFDSVINIIKPVYMVMKSPAVMLNNDQSVIEIKIVNDSENPVKVSLKNINHPEFNGEIPEIAAHSSYLYIENITFNNAFSELYYLLTVNPTEHQEIYRHVRIIENGYKNTESYQVRHSFTKTMLIRKGNISQALKLQSYAPLDKTLETYLVSMIHEPHGCFEQVSSTNYPNILAYRLLLKKGGYENETGLEHRKHLESGYRQLVNYETPTGGFSWYGTGPGNEALTAMGLLQFNKLSGCNVNVDEKMCRRNRNWLLGKQDHNGQFIQSPGKYGFANMSQDVAHAYITYVLHETGERNLERSISLVEKNLKTSKNLYNMALLCAIYIKGNNQAYSGHLEQLKTAFENIKNNKAAGDYQVRTIVNSSVIGAINETFAILATAIYKHQVISEYEFAKTICEYFQQQDKYAWGNMQSKAFVLEALAYHTPDNSGESSQPYILNYKVNDFSGEITLYPLTEQSIDLSAHLHEGVNTVQLEFVGNRSMELNLQQVNPLPFNNKKSSDLSLHAEFDKASYKQSDLAIYHVQVANTSRQILPQSVAIIAIPTGMNINPDELQFLTKQKICDFYEIKDNLIYLYWEEMNVSEKVNISLPFVCEVSGKYTVSACSVYKYYQPENKAFYLPKSILIE